VAGIRRGVIRMETITQSQEIQEIVVARERGALLSFKSF
jgi:hypothetical protein